MDSLTQMVLGAGIGEAILGKKVGNKAILWGGIIATIPDLDVIPTIWMDSVGRLSFHRGFSHSLAFFFLASPIFGWLLYKLYNKYEASWRDWTIFSFWVLFTHALLDCFTSWGTQLFWPHPCRVAWNTIFVVDPLYTIPFLITIVWLMFYNRKSKMRQRINYAGLIISSVYLMLTVVNKQLVNNAFEQGLSSSNIKFERYSTKPTPFNNILWFAVAETKEDYCIGYYSFLDTDKEIDFSHHKKNHELLDGFITDDNLQTLVYISNGYYAVEEMDDSLVFHDLRFGQEINLNTGKGDFVFSFFLKENRANGDSKVEIIQKPRNFSDITSEMFIMLWRRMMGDKEVRI